MLCQEHNLTLDLRHCKAHSAYSSALSKRRENLGSYVKYCRYVIVTEYGEWPFRALIFSILNCKSISACNLFCTLFEAWRYLDFGIPMQVLSNIVLNRKLSVQTDAYVVQDKRMAKCSKLSIHFPFSLFSFDHDHVLTVFAWWYHKLLTSVQVLALPWFSYLVPLVPSFLGTRTCPLYCLPFLFSLLLSISFVTAGSIPCCWYSPTKQETAVWEGAGVLDVSPGSSPSFILWWCPSSVQCQVSVLQAMCSAALGRKYSWLVKAVSTVRARDAFCNGIVTFSFILKLRVGGNIQFLLKIICGLKVKFD